MINFPDSPALNQNFTSSGVTWVWDGTKWVVGGSVAYLPIAGGTMTGAIVLAANAAANLQAVPLQQLNSVLAGGYLPLSGGTLTGNLNGTTMTFSGAINFTGTGSILSVMGSAYFNGVDINGDSVVVQGGRLHVALTSSFTGASTFAAAVNFTGTSAAFGVAGPAYFSGSDVNSDCVVVQGGHLNVKGDITPSAANGSLNCGIISNAWSNVYSYNYPTPSDPRLKKAVSPAPAGALDIVQKVTVHYFHYVHEEDDTPPHRGFMATDLQAALSVPEAAVVIGDDEDKTLAVNLPDLIALLWQAVQELSVTLPAVKP